MLEITLPTAFLAGLLTFLAPCTLPLVPAYIAFLAGSSKPNESVLVKRAISFISGFSAVIILLGIFVSELGRYVAVHRSLLVMIGGAFFIFFGLALVGLINIPIKSNGLPAKLRPDNNFSSFILGVIFAFGWSPCVGPILGSIYVLAAGTGSTLMGALLLFAYALGHGLPFILFAYFYDKSTKAIKILSKYSNAINKGAGIFLVLIGLFMLFGKYGVLLEFFKEIFNGKWQDLLLNYL